MFKVLQISLAGIFLLSAVQSVTAQKSYIEYYNEGIVHYEAGNYISYLRLIQQADSLRPYHPVLTYHLAAGLALNARSDEAVEVLHQRMTYHASDDFRKDHNFSSIRESGHYQALLEKFKWYHTPVRSSVRMPFHLDLLVHPEGIAYDESVSRFYIGDIRTGKILSYNRKGKDEKILIDLAALGYWSVSGMSMDRRQEGILWVTTSSLREFQHYTPEMEGRSALLKIDLHSPSVRQAIGLEGDHHLGDLTSSTDGRLFATDSKNPVVYVLEPGESELKPGFRDPRWWNLQGITISPDHSTLYVADYITGIYSIDLNTGSIKPGLNNNYLTRGADGIYVNGSSLLFIQNGTLPKRIGKISLDENGQLLEDTLLYTDKALDALEEPTLGVLTDDRFYYIANSPWSYYDENGNLQMNRPEIQIWELNLKNNH